MNSPAFHNHPNRKASWLCRSIIAAVLALLVLICGSCSDPLSRHQTLTTFFDGVPDLPPVEQLCENAMGDRYREFYQARADLKAGGAQQETEGERTVRSSHPPYAQKNCEGCHDFKSSNLLIRPKHELCFVCHKNFIKGANVHGPVAVGDCLACHLPHDSSNTALLQEPKSAICSKCHHEKRLAENMHIQVIEHQMECVDCHDPHSGHARYFLN